MTEHAFQAQVSEVLSLVINSLYSHPEVFLRELLSNASDALDKERFLAITEPSDSQEPLRIRLVPDEQAGTLTIDDNGVGMDEAELVKYLGTIAHSGSKEFLKQLKERKDMSLIGQFGVGFYSSYLVADKVTVISRKRGQNAATRWESDGKTGFVTEPAERAERGTAVILHLKEDQREFLRPYRIRELVTRYSDYVGHPIELLREQKPKEGEEAPATPEFDRINQASALWQRKASEISDEQYTEFYKHLTHDYEAPLGKRHFRVEGTQEFTGLLFVPKRPPFDLFNTEERHGVRLHVKRVFIMDDCKELLPRWLRFMRGVVDSEDLPLNVSREILQDSKLVRVMRKQVTKHALDLLDEIAEKRPDDYKGLWKSYGAVLKEGVHFDPEYKERLEKLFRFESNKAEGLTSLADYVSRMQEGQSAIYYILGPSRRTVESSPHLESLKARDLEVLYLTDPVDEWAVRALATFGDKPLRSAMDEKLELGKDDKSENAESKPTDAESALLKRFQEVLSEHVSEVRVSERLTDSPSCLVVPDGGLGPYIERLLRAQQGENVPSQKRILEINTKHGLIQGLVRLSSASAQDAALSEAIELIYDQALLAEGSPIDDPARMAKRLIKLLQSKTEAQLAGSAS
jgi:molecular chaperone HtpG